MARPGEQDGDSAARLCVLPPQQDGRNVLLEDANLVSTLVDLMHDKNEAIRGIASQTLDVIVDMDGEGPWAAQIKERRFRAHNEQWITAVEEDDVEEYEVRCWTRCPTGGRQVAPAWALTGNHALPPLRRRPWPSTKPWATWAPCTTSPSSTMRKVPRTARSASPTAVAGEMRPTAWSTDSSTAWTLHRPRRTTCAPLAPSLTRTTSASPLGRALALEAGSLALGRRARTATQAAPISARVWHPDLRAVPTGASRRGFGRRG